MLYDAQSSSPSNLRVVHAIDKVLDILQTTELFAPHMHEVTEEDPLTNDYVGGLCDVSHPAPSLPRWVEGKWFC